MKQSVNSRVFISIVAAFVVIASAIIVWVWRAPPSIVAPSSTEASPDVSGGGGGKAQKAAQTMADMKAAHGSVTAKERQQREEWKLAHPDGYTKQ